MKPEQVRAARERLEAATAGPWSVIDRHGEPRYVVKAEDPTDAVTVIAEGSWSICQPERVEDTIFIASAPADLRMALDALARVRALADGSLSWNRCCSRCGEEVRFNGVRKDSLRAALAGPNQEEP